MITKIDRIEIGIYEGVATMCRVMEEMRNGASLPKPQTPFPGKGAILLGLPQMCIRDRQKCG